MVKKKTKQTFNILFNAIVFFFLIGSAFAISYIFGLFFVLGFVIILYNKDIRKKPWKMILLFVGGLVTRLALGKLFS